MHKCYSENIMNLKSRSWLNMNYLVDFFQYIHKLKIKYVLSQRIVNVQIIETVFSLY